MESEMHWEEMWNGRHVAEGSADRRWLIEPSANGRATIAMEHKTSFGVVNTKVADCASLAEAQIFATAMDNAGHPIGTRVEDLLLDHGFEEAPTFSMRIAELVMESVSEMHSDVRPHFHHERRWFASEDRLSFATTSRLSVFPFHSFVVTADQQVCPDNLLIEPRVAHGRAAAPIIPTFAIAHLEILQTRAEMNGSALTPLQVGQQDDLAAEFAAGYRWHGPRRERGQGLIGMGM
jgi:hypothetical protein